VDISAPPCDHSGKQDRTQENDKLNKDVRGKPHMMLQTPYDVYDDHGDGFDDLEADRVDEVDAAKQINAAGSEDHREEAPRIIQSARGVGQDIEAGAERYRE
jgi:hypothetical protein